MASWNSYGYWNHIGQKKGSLSYAFFRLSLEGFAHDSTSSKHKEAKGGNLPHMAAFKERSRPASSCASVLPLSSESFECSATAEGSVLFPLPVPAHDSTLPAENSINPSLKEAKGGSLS